MSRTYKAICYLVMSRYRQQEEKKDIISSSAREYYNNLRMQAKVANPICDGSQSTDKRKWYRHAELIVSTYLAYLEIGLQMYKDEYLCEWLAIVYEFGHEFFVLDAKGYAISTCAQIRLNIFGSEVPNLELLPILQTKLSELKNYRYIFEAATKVGFEKSELPRLDWLDKICISENLHTEFSLKKHKK